MISQSPSARGALTACGRADTPAGAILLPVSAGIIPGERRVGGGDAGQGIPAAHVAARSAADKAVNNLSDGSETTRGVGALSPLGGAVREIAGHGYRECRGRDMAGIIYLVDTTEDPTAPHLASFSAARRAGKRVCTAIRPWQVECAAKERQRGVEVRQGSVKEGQGDE